MTPTTNQIKYLLLNPAENETELRAAAAKLGFDTGLKLSNLVYTLTQWVNR